MITFAKANVITFAKANVISRTVVAQCSQYGAINPGTFDILQQKKPSVKSHL